jgi:hypothetical protein
MGSYVEVVQTSGAGWTLPFVGRVSGLTPGTHTFTFQVCYSGGGTASTYTVTPGTREGANLVVLSSSPLATRDKNYVYQEVPSTGSFSGTSFTSLTSASITTHGRPLKIQFNYNGLKNNGGTLNIRIKVDGNEVTRGSTSNTNSGATMFTTLPIEKVVTGLSAGSHTVSVEWAVDAGTAEINTAYGGNYGNATTLYLEELITPVMDIVDTFANRPPAGIPGRRFRPSDGLVAYIDDGSVWRPDPARGALGYEPPETSEFSTVVGNTTGQTLSKNQGALLFSGTSISASSFYQYDTATLGSTFQIDIGYFWTPNNGANASLFGVGVRNTSDTKLVRYSLYRTVNSFIAQTQYFTGTTPGTVGLSSDQTYQIGPPGPIWLRVIQDGTDISFWVSSDGQFYRNLYQEAVNLHTTPNKAGIYFESTGFSNVFSFKVT